MQGDRLIDENAKWRRNWSTGLNLRVPIFDGYRIRSRIRQAETQLEALHYEILNLKRKSNLRLRRAFVYSTKLLLEFRQENKLRLRQRKQSKWRIQDILRVWEHS